VELQNVFGVEGSRGIVLQVHPNPMRSYCLVETNGVQVERVFIYDVLGRVVRVLSPTASRLTPNKFFWDGRDNQGKEVRSGVYFVRVKTDRGSVNQKLILMR